MSESDDTLFPSHVHVHEHEHTCIHAVQSIPSPKESKINSKNEKRKKKRNTSLLPLPNPLITGPDNRMGYGCSGPASGPATGSRGPSGRIFFFFGPFLRGNRFYIKVMYQKMLSIAKSASVVGVVVVVGGDTKF